MTKLTKISWTKNLRELQQTYGQRMSVTVGAETETGKR